MFPSISSRRILCLAVILLVTTFAIRLLLGISHITNTTILSHLLGRTSLDSQIIFKSIGSEGANLPLEQLYINTYHASYSFPPANRRFEQLFQQCQHRVSRHTRHIRLPDSHLLNISMFPSQPQGDESIEEFRTNRYFNPAIVPLPANIYTAQAPYRYILLSRLVTSGLHQESHICFADVCSPRSTSNYAISGRPCDESDIDVLGKHGGMRCVTKPDKLNIPPTPSRKCTGAWKTFPDIPGFHDPRLFWTGRPGEIWVEVNSGSQYGCVGLWIVDLRSVWPRLDELLKALQISGLPPDEPVSEAQNYKREGTESKSLDDIGAPMRFRYLTEITKNPRESRNEIEKNWVLFFPTRDEVWVQYEAFGVSSEQNLPNTTTGSSPNGTVQPATSHNRSSTSLVVSTESVDLVSSDTSTTSGLYGRGKMDTATTEPNSEEAKSELHNSPDHGTLASTFNPSPSAHMTLTQSRPPTATRILLFIRNEETDRGGRTIAQILNTQAHTTPNLTSPQELPCFSPYSPENLKDALNNSGNWHQGSNSLTLILCTHDQLQQGTCLVEGNIAGNTVEQDLIDQERRIRQSIHYDRLLTMAGFKVHFSIMHRKFTNIWDLPMRYERYFLVWEARKPFRILGMSKYPILFGSERARPWTKEQDFEQSSLSTDGSGKILDDNSQLPKSDRTALAELTLVTTSPELKISPTNPETASMAELPSDSAFLQPVKREGSNLITNLEDMALPSFQQDDSEAWSFSNRHPGNSEDGVAYFTYTPSIAWTFHSHASDIEDGMRRDLGTGTLDDEIIVGIGMDDLAQGFVRVKVTDVLGCMSFCADGNVGSSKSG